MHAITIHGLYIFYPNFHCYLYCRAISSTDKLSIKTGNSSNFGSKMSGLSLRAISNQLWVVMAHVQYLFWIVPEKSEKSEKFTYHILM